MQFALYQLHFAEKSRLSRRPELLERIIGNPYLNYLASTILLKDLNAKSTNIACLRELIKLPHVRQLQESSLGLSSGGPAGGRLGFGRVFLMVYRCFRDFEALRVDSPHLNKVPP